MIAVEDVGITEALDELEKQTLSFEDDWGYYNSEHRDMAIGIATPPALRKLLSMVGVPRIFVDCLAERLKIEGFRRGDSPDDADDEIWGWFRANSLESAQALQVRDSLIYGRAYITVSAPDEGEDGYPLSVPGVPRIKVESPRDLFAQVDPRTGRVMWAVRRVRDDFARVIAATLYLPDRTELFEDQGAGLKLVDTIKHGLGVVPVVPVVRSASAADLYGTSIISSEIRTITDAMSRCLMNLQTASELMAVPQRLLFGTTIDEINGENKSPLELYTSSYLVMESPEGKAVSLPQADLSNYTGAMQQMLKLAAAYTGLPPQYLSFADDNPASAEAIRAAESRMVATCEHLASAFGDAWESAMRVALLVMGKKLTVDDFRMETVWRDPATPTYAAKADAATKAYAGGAGPIPKEQVRIDMGYTPEQRRQMKEWDKESPMFQALNLYGGLHDGSSARTKRFRRNGAPGGDGIANVSAVPEGDSD